MHELATRILAGDPRAVARACRRIDDDREDAEALLRDLFPHTGKARIVGLTGAPGTGKSTLTDALITCLRARGERVGVLAIDPSSPFTGGALLGDRIRMQRHAADDQVFIRSFGTRGAHGGLSRSTADGAHVLDAWGANTILIETVGTGQVDVDVLDVAESVVVVVIPGMGDDVQANKAGILEVADVFALNKADREGADATERELAASIALGKLRHDSPAGHHHASAHAALAGDALRIVRTIATRGEGVPELLSAIDAHGTFLRSTEQGALRRAQRKRAHAKRHLGALVSARVLRELEAEIAGLAERVADSELDPYEASALLVAKLSSKR